jgi:hypothetical protein
MRLQGLVRVLGQDCKAFLGFKVRVQGQDCKACQELICASGCYSRACNAAVLWM